MRDTVLVNRKGKFLSGTAGVFICMAVIFFSLMGLTGCGSRTTGVDIPEDFIKDFIAKHETMVDRSLIYYYTKEDQSAVSEQVDLACRINESKGKLKILEDATFDFSNLQFELVDQKEDYVNDEPVLYLKVAVRGNYRMLLPEETRTIDADEVIILQMAHDEWKISASHNPWS